MALVNVLRFSDSSGALIADEAHWLLGRRKTYFSDVLHSLVEPELTEKLGLEVCYGGTGHPPFHSEVVARTRKAVVRELGGRDRRGAATVERVAHLALAQAQAVLRRKVDDVLRARYGIRTVDLIRGHFLEDGEKRAIGQAAVKDKALAFISWKEKEKPLRFIFENMAVITGYDPSHGFTIYYLSGEKTFVAYNSGWFEAIGPGRHAAGLVFAHALGDQQLHTRRMGYDPLEGVILLLRSALEATNYHHVGGYMRLLLIHGDRPTHAERWREITHHGGKMATELVRAHQVGQIEDGTLRELLSRLVFDEEDWTHIEEELFARATNPRRLGWLLSHFKPDRLPESPPVPAAYPHQLRAASSVGTAAAEGALP